MESKTERQINYMINLENNQCAPPIITEIEENDLPNESSIYNNKSNK